MARKITSRLERSKMKRGLEDARNIEAGKWRKMDTGRTDKGEKEEEKRRHKYCRTNDRGRESEFEEIGKDSDGVGNGVSRGIGRLREQNAVYIGTGLLTLHPPFCSATLNQSRPHSSSRRISAPFLDSLRSSIVTLSTDAAYSNPPCR